MICPPFGGSPFAELGFPYLTSKGASKVVLKFKTFYLNHTPAPFPIFTYIAQPDRQSPPSTKLIVQTKLLTKYLKYKNLPTDNDGLVPVSSQRIATEFSEKVWTFPGDHMQVVGDPSWPKERASVKEIYLDHCIFLAERELGQAKLNS